MLGYHNLSWCYDGVTLHIKQTPMQDSPSLTGILLVYTGGLYSPSPRFEPELRGDRKGLQCSLPWSLNFGII